jgi:hypothetical protein
MVNNPNILTFFKVYMEVAHWKSERVYFRSARGVP